MKGWICGAWYRIASSYVVSTLSGLICLLYGTRGKNMTLKQKAKPEICQNSRPPSRLQISHTKQASRARRRAYSSVLAQRRPNLVMRTELPHAKNKVAVRKVPSLEFARHASWLARAQSGGNSSIHSTLCIR
ncbi:hypothetical protein BGY98DRAFT_258158 [Russula aff. rugulosa BPL654]|nr:hypothetical protein BGY98DRAFT_258158 [Russula aff. rugulosa BPL654]